MSLIVAVTPKVIFPACSDASAITVMTPLLSIEKYVLASSLSISQLNSYPSNGVPPASHAFAVNVRVESG